MIIPRPAFPVLWRASLDELRASGVTLSDEEIVWLHTLALRATRSESAIAYLPRLITIGKLTFYAPTVACLSWLDEHAGKWWDKDAMPYKLARGWALTRGKNVDEFASMLDEPKARSTVYRYGLMLPMTMRQHDVLCDMLLGIEDGVGYDGAASRNDPIQWGALIADVCARKHYAPREVLAMTAHELIAVTRDADSSISSDDLHAMMSLESAKRMIRNRSNPDGRDS